MSAKDEAQAEILDVFASASRRLHDETNVLIQRQWRSLMIAGVMVIVSILVTIWAAFHFMRSPEHGAQIAALDNSSQHIQALAIALTNAGISCTDKSNLKANRKTCEDAKNAIEKYAGDHKKVIDNLNADDRQPKPEALSLTQLVGGTAILAVLGYLGLMRLQNLDQELHNLRSFMFEQISARVKELKETVGHDVTKKVSDELRISVDQALIKTKSDHEHFREESADIRKKVAEIAAGTEEEINKAKREALSQINDIQEELGRTLKKYPWLNNPKLREGLATLDNIPSVEKAHELATELTAQHDETTALAVLETIAGRELPGDKADFHNAHSQSMRLNNPTLALRIVEVGLKSFPDDYDLMADKAQALNALGRPLEAQQLLEDWITRKPHEFARGWRPVVFYAKVVEAGTLDKETEKKLIDAFEDVVKRAPHEDKVWSAYARFLNTLGRTKDAEAVLLRGISPNPFSQEIHFVLGELRLRTGNAAGAVSELETAVRFDYQDQFQPDVNPHAVICMLAQAYEANSNPDQAVRLYQAVVSQGARGSILTYAQQRLRMLSALEGKPIDIPEGQSPLAQLARLLKEHHDGDSGNES